MDRMNRMEVIRMIDNRELENIYSLKHGTTAMIVLLRGDVYVGQVDIIDYNDETITLIDGYVYENTIRGTIQNYFSEATIKEGDVLCCMDKSPLIVYVSKDKDD